MVVNCVLKELELCARERITRSSTVIQCAVILFLSSFFFKKIVTSQLDNGVSRVIFAFLCCTNGLAVNRTGRLIEKCLCSFFFIF